jgi:hypothetical protein
MREEREEDFHVDYKDKLYNDKRRYDTTIHDGRERKKDRKRGIFHLNIVPLTVFVHILIRQ